MNKLFVTAFFVVSLFAARGLEAQSVEKKSWEIHVKFGSQTYLNELDPDPGSAPLGGFLIGYNLSNRSMLGIHSASAGYEFDEDWVCEEPSISYEKIFIVNLKGSLMTFLV